MTVSLRWYDPDQVNGCNLRPRGHPRTPLAYRDAEKKLSICVLLTAVVRSCTVRIMKRLVRSSEVSDIDAKAQSVAKIPALCLMESAGLQIYQKWKSQLGGATDRLVFLCGGGNNGGDALVVARYAYNDGFRNILLVYTGTRLSPSCEVQRSIVDAYKIPWIDWDSANETDRHSLFENASWIVDGLVGTGLKGPLKESLQVLVEQANQSPAKRLAIDIPSAVGMMFLFPLSIYMQT